MWKKTANTLATLGLLVLCGWTPAQDGQSGQASLDELAKNEGKMVEIKFVDNLKKAHTLVCRVTTVRGSGGRVGQIEVRSDDDKNLSVTVHNEGGLSISGYGRAFDAKITRLAEKPLIQPFPRPPVATAFETEKTRDGQSWIIRYGAKGGPPNDQQTFVVYPRPGASDAERKRGHEFDLIDSADKPCLMLVDGKAAWVVRLLITDKVGGIRHPVKSPEGTIYSGYFILNKDGHVVGGQLCGFNEIKADPRAVPR